MAFQLSRFVMIITPCHFSSATLEQTLKAWTVGPSIDAGGVDLVSLLFFSKCLIPKPYWVILGGSNYSIWFGYR